MPRFTDTLTRAGTAAVALLTAAACGSAAHSANAPGTKAAGPQVVSPSDLPSGAVLPTAGGSIAPPTGAPTMPATVPSKAKPAPKPRPSSHAPIGGAIAGTAFAMHWLSNANGYPTMGFGAARVWDAGATWAQLQPTSSTPWSAGSNSALAHLDSIVSAFNARGVQPLLTLGMTPAWAAHSCRHVIGGTDWGIGTCAPKGTSASSAWGRYVSALAKRYQGKIRYFELWNEPSLHNGYNDSIATLGLMQRTAASIVHRYGAKLVSPSIPFTNGSPDNGIGWLNTFFHTAGGRSFDVFGVHLYPADGAVRGGYGPEWSVQTGLAAARSVAAANGISAPIWNTEMNIGRQYAHTGYGGGSTAAGMVARTYVLATENHVQRTFWYAADDRSWGGTWLEAGNLHSLTTAGVAYRATRSLLVGARPTGCTSHSIGTNKWHYRCGWQRSDGTNVLALWSTSGSWRVHAPAGTHSLRTATGGSSRASGATAFTVGASPVFLIGTFAV